MCSRHFTLTARLSTKLTDLIRCEQSQMNVLLLFQTSQNALEFSLVSLQNQLCFRCFFKISNCTQCHCRVIWDIDEISLVLCSVSHTAIFPSFNVHRGRSGKALMATWLDGCVFWRPSVSWKNYSIHHCNRVRRDFDCRQLNAKSPTNEPLLGNTAPL